MGILSKISEWRMKFFLWIGLPAIAAAGIYFGGVDLMPAWEAHNGGGVVGTFTAEREECGKRSCSLYGTWVAADGSRSRPDVILYDEPDTLTDGRTTEAVDTGASGGVFATAGGSMYLMVTGFLVGGIVALVAWVFVLRNALRRRRSAAAVPA